MRHDAGMLFNTQGFVLGFLPAALGLFHAARTRAQRQWVLVAASLAFYGAWDARFVPALVGLTLANWLIVRWWARRQRQAVLGLGIALNLLVLGVCKYADFIGANVAWALGTGFTPFGIVLPLGVSFFTFQKIGYLMDLRRGDRHVYGLLDFFAFVTFFPQLIAGPLVRHNEIIPQFAGSPSGPGAWEDLSRGLALFTVGFAKKSVLADTLAPMPDALFAQAAAGPLSLAEGWAAAGGYALQIYFDFSGYSDMALGLALMFGLRLPFNFDAPYRAASVREFWRRWHMTLSRFLRDYVYVPLGGSSRGSQAANVLLTMLLGGLWRGGKLWGRQLMDTLDTYSRSIGVGINAEVLPSAVNKLELTDEKDVNGIPKARVTFTPGDNENALDAHAQRTMTGILEAAGASDIRVVARTAHTLGTAVMGTDPADSVVDAFGRSYEVDNLWICDSSVFPSSLPANPALTIMALSLRTAEQMLSTR